MLPRDAASGPELRLRGFVPPRWDQTAPQLRAQHGQEDFCWDSLLVGKFAAGASSAWGSSPREQSAPGIAPWHRPHHGGFCELLQPPLPLGPSTASLLASQRLVTPRQFPLLRAQLGPGTPETLSPSRAESRGTGLAPKEQRIPRRPPAQQPRQRASVEAVQAWVEAAENRARRSPHVASWGAERW